MKTIFYYSFLLLFLFNLAINADTYSQYCDDDVPSFTVDLSGSPDNLYVSPCIERTGQCCNEGPSVRCIEFYVTLHPGANSFSVSCITDSCPGASCPGGLDVNINCSDEPVEPGIPACIPDTVSSPFVITVCKQGSADPARYVIESSSIPPLPNAEFDISTGEGCSPLNITFNSSSCNDSVFWDFGDGETICTTSTSITHTYDNNLACTDDSYLVQMTAYNAGLSETSGETIIVHPVPDINISSDENPLKGCPPYQVTLTGSSVCAENFNWDFGDGTFLNSDIDTTLIHIYYNNSTTDNIQYTLSLTADNNFGCSNTVIKDITVYHDVIADFSMSPDSEGCEPFEVNFINNSLGANNYQWDFGDGSPPENQQDPQHIFTSSGSDTTIYFVQLNAQSAKCADSVIKEVTVIVCTDIAQYENSVSYNIFPNPFTTKTTISVKNIINRSFYLNIYDLNGKKVRTIYFKNNYIILNREGLPAGMYFIEFIDDSGITGRDKIIIQ